MGRVLGDTELDAGSIPSANQTWLAGKAIRGAKSREIIYKLAIFQQAMLDYHSLL